MIAIYDLQVALKNLTRLVKQFKIQLLVEGVETKQQLDYLRQHHVAIAEGNYLSPPLQVDGFEYLLSGKSEWLKTLFNFPPI